MFKVKNVFNLKSVILLGFSSLGAFAGESFSSFKVSADEVFQAYKNKTFITNHNVQPPQIFEVKTWSGLPPKLDDDVTLFRTKGDENFVYTVSHNRSFFATLTQLDSSKYFPGRVQPFTATVEDILSAYENKTLMTNNNVQPPEHFKVRVYNTYPSLKKEEEIYLGNAYDREKGYTLSAMIDNCHEEGVYSGEIPVGYFCVTLDLVYGDELNGHNKNESEDQGLSSSHTSNIIIITESEVENECNNLPHIVHLDKGIMDIQDKGFYSYHNEKNDVWVNMERVTEETIGWWKKRFGCESYMVFNREIQYIKSLNHESPGVGRTCYGFDSPDKLMYWERIWELETFVKMRGKTDEERNEYATELNKYLPISDPRSLSTPEKDILHPLSNQYAGAFRSFIYNLEKYKEFPTWVAFISATERTQPLSISGESVLSPDIKMAMTVSADNCFYSPFGIHKSLIAEKFDKEKGICPKANSMTLHSGVGKLMGDIIPEAKYMVVRPLSKMEEILKKSGVSCTATTGGKRDNNLPYIHYDLHSDLYSLNDPRTNEVYSFGRDHWFSKHFYMIGATSQNLNFVTADREALADLAATM